MILLSLSGNNRTKDDTISLPVCVIVMYTDKRSETTSVTQETNDSEIKIAEFKEKIKELERLLSLKIRSKS